MLFLASNGYRCLAHDRRGHGRSSQPWNGNEMDTFVDDLLDARRMIERWRVSYNTARPHPALGRLTPQQFSEN